MSSGRIKIALVSIWDARDVRAWSGTSFYMGQGLEAAGMEVHYVCPLPGALESVWTRLGAAPIYFKQLYYQNLKGQRYEGMRDPYILRLWARQAARRLSSLDFDIVLGTGSLPVAMLRVPQPIVFWADATYASYVDFYAATSSLSPATLRNGSLGDQMAFDNARAAIFSSDWAAQSARDRYHVAPERVHVIPYGTNLSNPPTSQQAREYIQQRSHDGCDLLFLGMDWERKGGPLALETVAALVAQGIPARLTIVGPRTPPVDPLPHFACYEGYISKGEPEGLSRLEAIFRRCHFLLLPSRADCTPMVFGEANAYGMPVITANIGGIPTLVHDGRNGFKLPATASASDYAGCIAALWRSPGSYRALAQTSRDQYEQELCWPVACARFRRLCEQVLS